MGKYELKPEHKAKLRLIAAVIILGFAASMYLAQVVTQWIYGGIWWYVLFGFLWIFPSAYALYLRRKWRGALYADDDDEE